MRTIVLIAALYLVQECLALGSGPWDRVGPHNIFDAYNDGGKGQLPMGEAGTLAGASSLAAAPHVIYAGGDLGFATTLLTELRIIYAVPVDLGLT